MLLVSILLASGAFAQFDQYFFDKKVENDFDINPYPTINVPVFWDVPEK